MYKGEKIAKLHLKAIKEYWRDIYFTETPWSKEIEELKCLYNKKMLEREIRENREEINIIEVTFSYNDSFQKAGAFAISPQVAKWLGEQLIKVSRGDIEKHGSAIKVKKDTKISPF